MIHEEGRVYCIDPLVGPMRMLSRRWTLLVVGVLGNRDGLRFNEAKRAIPGITARALSSSIDDLVRTELVERAVAAGESPPAVAYRLTHRGRHLRRALIPLIEWAEAPDSGGRPAKGRRA